MTFTVNIAGVSSLLFLCLLQMTIGEKELLVLAEGRDPVKLALLLKHREPSVRAAAADCLAKLAPDSEQALPALVDALKDEDNGVRERSALALRQLGSKAQAALPVLVSLLLDQKVGVRRQGAWAIETIVLALDDKTRNGLRQLPEGLYAAIKGPKGELRKDQPVDVQIAVLATLLGLGHDRAPTGFWANAMNVDSNAELSLGSVGLESLPVLKVCLKDARSKVRMSAAAAVAGIQIRVSERGIPFPDEGVLVLVAAIEDPEPEVVRQVIYSLGTIGKPAAKTAVPGLIAALKHRSRDVRLAAAEHLRSFGTHAKIALPALKVALKDDDASVREEAAQSIRQISE